MMCARCRTIIQYSFALCWWHCRCRIWQTDEQIARELN